MPISVHPAVPIQPFGLAETSPVGTVLHAQGLVLAAAVVVATSPLALVPITMRAIRIDPAIALRSD
jgi:Mg/Co/Ni transporter MgtE